MIPKTIHYVWVGGKDKPKKVLDCIETWRTKYPEYKICEWNETTFDINSNEYVKSAYIGKKWAFVSDYIRMYAIFNYGGIYFDTDVIAIDTLDDFLNFDCFVGYESNNVPFTAVFGAIKGHNLIKKILAKYDSAPKRFDSSATNTLLVSSIIISDYKCKLGNKKQILNDNILVLPKEILCNPTMKSRTIHAFTASWNSENKMSLIGRFDNWLRGKSNNKFKILIYRILEFLIFIPKRFIGNLINHR